MYSIVHGHAIYLDEGTGGSREKPFVIGNNAHGGGRPGPAMLSRITPAEI